MTSLFHVNLRGSVVPLLLLLAFTMGFFTSCSNTSGTEDGDELPNILLLVADDLGYADLGCFGSNIRTPNIDQLAAEGVLFTRFHSAPSCAPTRASLLSGADNHMAGVGSQFHRTGDQWGYEGYLTDRVVLLPQLLGDHGYRTYMTGKWHLGGEKDQLAHARGFDRSFILHQGAANHYNNLGFVSSNAPSIYSLDGKEVSWPENGYSTDVYTDYLIRFIEEDRERNQPFFAFAAYTSPHWPLQVDESYWKKYEGKYDEGYEVLRKQRLQSLKDADIISEDRKLPPKLPMVPDWDSLSPDQQRKESRKMELYAGMVENLDYHVGRIINYLKKIGEYRNTLIVFLSDNGAAAENFYERGPFTEFLQANYDNSYENMGSPTSFVSYDHKWAEAGSAPFRYHKQYTYEGGIRTPMIIRYPGNDKPGRKYRGFVTLTDLAPTFYDLAGVEFPSEYKGNEIHPLEGTSLMPVLNGENGQVHSAEEAWIMEHNHHALVRKGRWKLVNPQNGWDEDDFELYDLEEDPEESIDVKARHPEIYRELLGAWEEYRENYRIQNFMESN